MKEFFQYVVNEYQEAYGEPFAEHPLAKILRETIPETISAVIDQRRYKVQGSPGQGNWTSCPWIAIFDILITTSAQFGYYPVFLFREDMSGFYLSLNQGVTEVIKQHYTRDAKEILRLKADDFKAQISLKNTPFGTAPISLKTQKGSKSKLPSLYEAGNIISKYYSAFNIPDSKELISDIKSILSIYENISYNDSLVSTSADTEADESYFKGIENLTKFRFHKRIERNTNLSKKVKEIQGYTCSACGLNFEKIYGELGKNFIEAHHLIPLSHLKAEKVQLDARVDFTVLCSNCHSMIHRYSNPSDLSGFKSLLRN